MCGVGLLLRLHGAVAHVLHAQRRRDDQHLIQCLARARLQNHAADTRVQRQLGQLLACRRQFIDIIHRTQFVQQLVAIGNGPARRPLQKRKVFNDAQLQRLHPQDDARQGGAQNLGVREALAAVEVLLVIQPNADTVGHTPAPTRALVGRRLADRLHQQLFHFAAKAVALDTRRTRIDHIPNAGHSQRRLSHIGRQHHSSPGVAVKNTVLLSGTQAREQRQHLGIAHDRLVAEVLAQVVGRIADFALAGQEDQNVALVVRVAPEFVHTIGNCAVQIVLAGFFKRPIALLHREHSARHHDDGSRTFA